MNGASVRYSRGLVALSLGLSGPVLDARLGKWNKTHTRSKSSKSTGLQPNGTRTFGTLVAQTLNASKSCAEDSPAKTLAKQEKAQGLKANAPCYGVSLQESSVKFDHASSSWKTFQCSFTGDLTLFSGTWPRSGMMRNGIASQLPPSVPRTCVTGSSSWPTPTVADNFTGNLQSSLQKPGSRHSVNLSQAVHLWPTPAASQNHKKIRPLAPSEDAGKHGKMLVGAVGEADPSAVGGYLNPEWVEWLMGFPIGWTAVDALETPSSPKSPNTSGASS